MFIHRFEFFVIVVAVAAVCSVENNEDRPRNHLVKETEKNKDKKRNNKQEQIWCVHRKNWMSVPILNDRFNYSKSFKLYYWAWTVCDSKEMKENRNTYHVTICVNYIGTIDQNQWKLKPIARVCLRFSVPLALCMSFYLSVSCSWIFIQSIHIALKIKINKNSHE